MVYPKCRLVLRTNPVELEDFEGVIDIYCRGRAAKVYIKTGSAVAALRGLVGRLEGKQWGARPDQILPSASAGSSGHHEITMSIVYGFGQP